jgi:hypothetical protein
MTTSTATFFVVVVRTDEQNDWNAPFYHEDYPGIVYRMMVDESGRRFVFRVLNFSLV